MASDHKEVAVARWMGVCYTGKNSKSRLYQGPLCKFGPQGHQESKELGLMSGSQQCSGLILATCKQTVSVPWLLLNAPLDGTGDMLRVRGNRTGTEAKRGKRITQWCIQVSEGFREYRPMSTNG